MIVLYGEILIDMNIHYQEDKIDYFVGGAPFNVAYSIKKFKENALFVGNVGKDYFGQKIIDFVSKHGFNSKYIYKVNNNTTLAIVNNDENGERSFSFLREDSADYQFNEKSLMLIEDATIVHIGSLMISKEKGFAFAKKIIQTAKRNNKIISFDINYRSDIFKNTKQAITRYNYIISKSDIIKLSLDELYLLTNLDNLDEALKKLDTNHQKIFVTLGKDGSILYQDGNKYYANSIDVESLDTTGAGDAFYGTILASIESVGFDNFFKDKDNILLSLKLANIQGALATRKKGALSSVVNKDTLYKYL